MNKKMQHSNFITNPQNWLNNRGEKNKLSQIEMLKRHHKDYSETDYVLWIIPELFHNTILNLNEQSINLEIEKEDGETINVNGILRMPYPNKKLIQYSMLSGKQKLFGVPLVFKTFEELCQIKGIFIEWNIDDEYDKSKLNIEYNLSFEKHENPEYRFYTVFSKDKVCFKRYEEKYMKEFDYMDSISLIEENDNLNYFKNFKKETLKGEYMGDFHAEPSFGFIDLK